MPDRSHNHAGNRDVHAVNRLARHLHLAVQALGGRSDQTELIRSLQFRLFRRRFLRRSGGEFAKGGRFFYAGVFYPRTLVGDYAVASHTLGGIHAPLLGSGLKQHVARLRASLAHHVPKTGRSGATTGDLQTGQGVDVFGAAGAELEIHRPGAFHFLGEHHQVTVGGALTHFALAGAQRDRIVRGDMHPGIQFRHVAGGRCITRGQMEAHHESTANRRD